MHQQLTDKNIVCKELIKALEECHTSVWARYFGGCNQIKHDLNMCLRKERIERTKRNGEDAKYQYNHTIEIM
ncbi:cytochrome c oxidase biogenesis cmc1 [Pyrrhoderma noxium]|uniref:COX assembly mitochondrial protein n=1 Tax=Pyrrhoderma noxium TaxID=2282107 RepID=A0A286UVU9_9AGAM|nr:cytochrome c oxidase biogenesis cmc1 [Pyrrhoderma noxium]